MKLLDKLKEAGYKNCGLQTYTPDADLHQKKFPCCFFINVYHYKPNMHFDIRRK